jgi:hypothetical protein
MFEEERISEENAKKDEELGEMILDRSIWAISLDQSTNGNVVKLDLKATDVFLPSISQSNVSKFDNYNYQNLFTNFYNWI